MLRFSVGTVAEYIKDGLFTMSSPDDEGDTEEHDDNDPVNGRFVNKKEAELCAAEDLAKSENDAKKLAEISHQISNLLEAEAKRGNPLATFYLGVRCVTGRGEENDMARGAQLLVTAEQLGVRRATEFLYSYFAK